MIALVTELAAMLPLTLLAFNAFSVPFPALCNAVLAHTPHLPWLALVSKI